LQKYANAEDQETSTEEQQTKNEDDDDNDKPVQSNYKPSASAGGRSRVYLDIEIAGSLAGRIEIEVRKA
jgi:peptidyl-prolyl isomerase E (cyclophilin E)